MPSGGVAAAAERLLSEVAGGRLARPPVTVRFWDGSELCAETDRPATVVLRDPAAVVHMLRAPGQLGLARAWVDGTLDVEGDLESVLRTRAEFAGAHLSTADRARLARAVVRALGTRLLRPPPIPAIEARLSGRRHWLARDRVAVRHHYDVSNRFYRLVLGPSMVYSCAYFAGPDDTLEAAQERKLDLICRKLRLREGERFLDIGCGWGALVMHAAAHYGARAVGVTLSEPQAELARQRVADAGLTERVEVRVQDYREIHDGPFDKIASVGMYEHVGRAELAHYAGTVAELLRPGGLFLNHGITRLVPHAPEPDPFISRYVFPDGELHPLADVVGVLQGATLEVRDVESLRDHYGLTLRRWVSNLAAHRDEAISEVGPQRERVWRLYMLGSALGFEAGEISVHQVLAASPGAPHDLPLTRS
ncbi:MAG TPA: cyclopropane-fatty-acyl-phospholipid synthase family protein [Solirubrobacteraceae bacterium]|nr:cyclopropane-fatty-acyl-phospholipid synthase family protein [Solirubrobacteraceae bacterium]